MDAWRCEVYLLVFTVTRSLHSLVGDRLEHSKINSTFTAQLRAQLIFSLCILVEIYRDLLKVCKTDWFSTGVYKPLIIKDYRARRSKY